ncbi:hypothetical protein N9S30_00130 [bacterium]|nr:hypothetical protein [bacterium]
MGIVALKLSGAKTVRTCEIVKTRYLHFSRTGKTGKLRRMRMPVGLKYTVRGGFVTNEYTFDQLFRGISAHLEKNHPKYNTTCPEVKAQVTKQASGLAREQLWQKQYTF